MRLFIFACIALGHRAIATGVSGEAFGMATGTTGGGSATAAAPSDTAELESWLSDDVARVILIDKAFDFTDSLGTTTGSGCYQDCDVAQGGQDYIGTLSCSGSTMTALSDIEYYAAGASPLLVGSNKSIVGVGTEGVIKGRGLRVYGATNVIIQNVFVTDINPEHVWGGDAITIQEADKVWIDHCKFSLIGRQMIVTGYDAAGHVTISNNEFDGNTDWSATCNRQHYWTLLLLGAKDYCTFYGNYLHDLSGRAPHYGTTDNDATNVFHAVNNYFENMAGHAFDIGPNTWSLIEGNVFSNVTTPMTADSTEQDSAIFNVLSGSTSECASVIGRDCVENEVIDNSGSLTGVSDTTALTYLAEAGTEYIMSASSTSDVASSAKANAGIGKV
ncbi:pectin lyase-like protein [Aspergillus sclerotiicarbonarius CBS 121057]|uniref:pectin lyase n=1 Tax=Aspergillus sclerotiicarbonarius (strain CBS 121057 / IBT 28362) TaxID=1448318 RepID=A0A319EL28_ASPSB|nr:pectin lyase-like protein [Aspergillus sclerotiicarbonarius CBS 121057]